MVVPMPDDGKERREELDAMLPAAMVQLNDAKAKRSRLRWLADLSRAERIENGMAERIRAKLEGR